MTIKKAKIIDHGLPNLIKAKKGINIIKPPSTIKLFFSQTSKHKTYILNKGMKAFHFSIPHFSNIFDKPMEDSNHAINKKASIPKNTGEILWYNASLGFGVLLKLSLTVWVKTFNIIIFLKSM